MAQSGFTPIKLYLSTTAAAVPLAADLAPGELAINNNDGKLFYEDSSGVVQVIATKAGSSGDVVGPASATDNAVARFDLTTGKLIQNSAVIIADDGTTAISVNSSVEALRITQTGAGNAILVEDSANPDATPFVVDASGNVGVGVTTALFNASLSIAGTSTNSTVSGLNFGNDANAFVYRGLKTRATDPYTQTVVSSGDNLAQFSGFGSDGTNYIQAANITVASDGAPGTNDMPGRLVFSTTADGAATPTERVRITSTGKFGFNTSAPGTNTYLFAGQVTGGTNSGSVVATPTIQSDVTVNANIFRSDTTTQAAAFTLSTLRHFSAVQGTLGAGSAITDQFGFIAESSLTGATNNYGFYSDIAAGTNRYNFYANGTADNLFQGKVGIGTAPYSNLQLLINGTVISTSTSAYAVLNTAASDTNTSVAFNGFFTQLSTSTTALTQLNYYYANQGTFSGTVALQRGFYVSGTLTGATTNIGFNSDIAAGTGRYNFYAGGTAQNVFQGQTSLGGAIGSEALRATPVASAVNYVEVLGAITTGSPSITAAGSDTNIDLTLTPKGTGNVRFGTLTANADAPITGYITIKDSGGTTRKLAIIA